MIVKPSEINCALQAPQDNTRKKKRISFNLPTVFNTKTKTLFRSMVKLRNLLLVFYSHFEFVVAR